MNSKSIIRIASITGLILLVPLVAVQFTDEVAWSMFDFAVAGVLLFAAGLTYELATSKTRDVKRRATIGAAAVVVLALVWVQLAVGIFD